jgi:membrane protein
MNPPQRRVENAASPIQSQDLEHSPDARVPPAVTAARTEKAQRRYERIAEAAYRRAERRGFAFGGEVDDWLAAEREYDAATLLTGGLDNIKAFLLDIDGTLVDSNDFHVRAWQQAFDENGCPIEYETIRKQIGKGADMLIPALLPDSGDRLRKSISKRHDELFHSLYLPQVEPFPQATDLIFELHKRGSKVLLASSAKARELEHYISLLKVKDFLVNTTSADDVESSKPAADIFASALEKVRPIPANDTLAVGDTPYDVLAARKCGIRTIAVRSGGFPDSELAAAGPMGIYDSVGALLSALITVTACAP